MIWMSIAYIWGDIHPNHDCSCVIWMGIGTKLLNVENLRRGGGGF
jgi:hypothetical protein